mmetsp:Transcript_15094/g.25833  ORF Transcript_15094/g.25833 Transcript_15094/m.25833 type:complete len:94 (-) Transcript_15094:399-680(-)
METNIEETRREGNAMGMEAAVLAMVICIKGNGRMIISKATVCFSDHTRSIVQSLGVATAGNGNTVNEMATGNAGTSTEIVLLVNGKTMYSSLQ